MKFLEKKKPMESLGLHFQVLTVKNKQLIILSKFEVEGILKMYSCCALYLLFIGPHEDPMK